MTFSSPLFLFIFLPLILFVYYFLLTQGNIYAQNVILLVASLLLYAWGEPVAFLIMFFSIVVNFFCGRHLGTERKSRKRFSRLVFGVIFNIALLGVYKLFGTGSVTALFGEQIPRSGFALPVGISFFTLQSLSYLLDVYRGKVQPQRTFSALALYISFFPVLLAGPLVRYSAILRQLRQRTHSLEKFAEGAQRFIIGLSKKVLIAGTVGQFADMAFVRPDISAPIAWVGVAAYALQFYFAFSGYADMALGLGKMFGFSLPENFNYPYISTSVTGFWRRWNISLSLWFRTYLYAPLGGETKSLQRNLFNVLVVFFAIGLWYGAGWTFVVWALFHALFLALEKAFLRNTLRKLPRLVGWLYTMVVVLVGWVLFRAETLEHAFLYLKAMVTFTDSSVDALLASANFEFLAAFLIGVIGSTPVLPWLRRVFLKGKNPMSSALSGLNARIVAVIGTICCILLLLLSIIYATGSSFNPFQYF